MNQTDEHNNLKENILRSINAKDISMRPKLYYTVRIGAVFVVAAAALGVSIFILNFILFSIRINSHDALLGFGPRGLGAFIAFFPWHLLVIDVALIVVLQSLLREFRFGYRTPAVYILLALAAGSLGVGYVLDRGTGFNDDVLERSDRHEVYEPIEVIYEQARRPMPPERGVCLCRVVSVSGNTLRVQDSRGGTTTVTVLLPANDPHATSSAVQPGDLVFIAGDLTEGVIHAFGLQKVVAPKHPTTMVPMQHFSPAQ